MNKKLVIFSIVLFVIASIIIITLSSNVQKNVEISTSQTTWIEDNEYLYDMAVYFLTEETENKSENREQPYFRDFATYHGFGIKQKENTKYAYLWIKEQAYYAEDGEYKMCEEKSLPYVFTFVNDKITVYAVADKNGDFEQSVRGMIDDEIEDKVIEYNDSELNMDETVKEYYNEVLNSPLEEDEEQE